MALYLGALFVLIVGGMFLSLCAASMLGTVLKRRRLEIEAETSEVYGSPEGRWPQ